jgi:hypothetical protein
LEQYRVPTLDGAAPLTQIGAVIAAGSFQQLARPRSPGRNRAGRATADGVSLIYCLS